MSVPARRRAVAKNGAVAKTSPPRPAAARRRRGDQEGGWLDILAPHGRVRTALPSLRVPGRGDMRRLQRELPTRAMMATGQLAEKLRELTGHDVVDLETMQDLIGVAFRAAMVRDAHRKGDYQVDDFGFEEQWAEVWSPLLRLIYRKYWRVESTGLGNVPRSGGALLVSNHAGVFPWDGAMIKVAVHDNVYDRQVRALVASWMFTTPGVSWMMRRSGQTLGHPDDTHRLLSNGELVLVFPEGVRGTGKPFAERYKLRRFGRGGYVEAAIRAGVPIIPISVMGSEETYPMLGDIKPLAKILGLPYFPITPTLPWLGPLGMLPLPSKWRIQFHEAVRTDELAADSALDRGRVLEISDSVREAIQSGVIDLLSARRTVFRG